MEKSVLLAKAREIMLEFSELTGLSGSGKPPKRYLWTDAFAVCNFLELYRQTKETDFMDLARRLVAQVHEVLGRHRSDDPRTGWLSGLGEEEGSHHPTAGGLRIGKPLNERRPGEPYDEQLEWDRDGQYYHYLTKWMQALNQVSRITGDFGFNRWALELGKTAQARFVTLSPSGDRNRMFWKMSIDLSYPLIRAMGHHDPLDGLITFRQVQATADQDPGGTTGLDLHSELAELERMCRGQDWTTDDALGIGGLLTDAYRAQQLTDAGKGLLNDLPASLLEASLSGLTSLEKKNFLDRPADFRLAFRELGLAIGLQALERLQDKISPVPGRFQPPQALSSQLEKLAPYIAWVERIDSFWLDRRNQAAGSWTDHREINRVMLATSLAPDGYLTLA